jgi:hypothetical protein
VTAAALFLWPLENLSLLANWIFSLIRGEIFKLCVHIFKSVAMASNRAKHPETQLAQALRLDR